MRLRNLIIGSLFVFNFSILGINSNFNTFNMLNVYAAEITNTWDSGNTTVTLDSEGTLIVTAKPGTDGRMGDVKRTYSAAKKRYFSDAPWRDCDFSSVKKLVIQDGVTYMSQPFTCLSTMPHILVESYSNVRVSGSLGNVYKLVLYKDMDIRELGTDEIYTGDAAYKDGKSYRIDIEMRGGKLVNNMTPNTLPISFLRYINNRNDGYKDVYIHTFGVDDPSFEIGCGQTEINCPKVYLTLDSACKRLDFKFKSNSVTVQKIRGIKQIIFTEDTELEYIGDYGLSSEVITNGNKVDLSKCSHFGELSLANTNLGAIEITNKS